MEIGGSLSDADVGVGSGLVIVVVQSTASLPRYEIIRFNIGLMTYVIVVDQTRL